MDSFGLSVELFVENFNEHAQIWAWCTSNHVRYEFSVPIGRDWVYIYHFEDLATATWFKLTWSELLI